MRALLPAIVPAGLSLMTSLAHADVRLPNVLSDDMVVQQKIPVRVWGWADPGESVTVTFAGRKAATTAAVDGAWTLTLPPAAKTGGPYPLVIAGKNRIELKNVLVGEVWICSGQSNMDFTVAKTAKRSFAGTENANAEIAAADHPQIRMFTADWKMADVPQKDVPGRWAVCSPGTVGDFSAVAYFFARDLQKKLGVPIGLITCAYGASTAQAWVSRESLTAEPDLRKLLEAYDAACRDWDSGATKISDRKAFEAWEAAAAQAKADNTRPPRAPRPTRDPHQDQHNPSVLYNGMIAPMVSYPVRGAIWYQGESNVATADGYRSLMNALIRDWRRTWSLPTMPFLQVQIAPHGAPDTEPRESRAAVVREAQRDVARSLPKVGMVVTTDVGESKDIHPCRKAPVGARLALLARKLAYGENRLTADGPTLKEMKIEGAKAILTFDNVGSGLEMRVVDNKADPVAGDKLAGFAVAGADGKYVWAEAAIVGKDQIAVSSLAVVNPAFVRYGWSNYPVVNLYNSEGLPASPFIIGGVTGQEQ